MIDTTNLRLIEDAERYHRDGPERILLRPTDLAARWHVSVGHLANLRAAGEGCSYLRIGRSITYRLSDVLAVEDAAYVRLGA